VFIDGDGIECRAVEREDVPFLQRWANHPEVRRYLGVRWRPYSEEEYEAQVYERYDTNEDGITVLVCPTDPAEHDIDAGDTDDGDAPPPVGSVQLYPIQDQQGWANVAYWVAPPAQGNGYATRATSLVVDYAFEQLGLHRVSATALAPNEGSLRVLEKLGFIHEGTKREVDWVDDEYVDERIYGLLREEWQDGEPDEA